MSRVSFNDAYKEWRNRARKHDPQSIVHEALRLLCEPSADQVAELKKAPWLTMLMVKWVCQDKYLDGKPASAITRPQLDSLRQKLWEFPDRLDRGDRTAMPLRLFVRQLLRPQLGLQRGITRSFVREAVLLAEQGEDYPLRKLFREKTGFDVLDFIDLSLAVFTVVLDGKRQLQADYFKPLLSSYAKQTVSSYLSAIARSFPELVSFCRSLPGADRKVASEYFEFPVLTRYPFFRAGNQLTCWHPTVFYRGLEGFVHSVLSEAGQDYMERFSRLFESHVVTEAKRVPTKFIDENELCSYIAAETQVPDGLLSFSGCNVFIESKAGLFNESLMTVGSSELFAHKTRAIKTAANQAWATSVSLREQRRAPAEVLSTETDYLLIITNKELGTSRGTSFASMYPEGTLDYPNPDAERLLPLGRIYVLAIEDFERLTSAAAKNQLDVPAFLRSCVEDDADPKRALLLFEQHLNRRRVLMDFSEPVEKAIDDSSARLEKALSS
jgi:hypothetical protein